MSLNRDVGDRIYIGDRIMLEVLDIGSRFAVIEFRFWRQPLPEKLHPLPNPARKMVKACRDRETVEVVPGVTIMVTEVIPLEKATVRVWAPDDVKVDRGEIRQKQHLQRVPATAAA